ncbi:hypothetical protein ACIGGE_10565 [Qipengyuania sp. NPDC077410]|uniref:hypothetical protein n=1 Tax=Qipengyuania sp. NPDC077410 TaxID=3364496 RepID=UPI0037C51D2B
MDKATDAVMAKLKDAYVERETIKQDREHLHEELREVINRMVDNHMERWLLNRTIELAAQMNIPLVQAKMLAREDDGYDKERKSYESKHAWEDIEDRHFVISPIVEHLEVDPMSFCKRSKYQNWLYRLYRKLGGYLGDKKKCVEYPNRF